MAWFILSLLTSALNDALTKALVSNMHSLQLSFLRSVFGVISLVPIVLHYGVHTLKTSNFFVHAIRGVILFFGISAWIYGLKFVQVSTATVISFTIPIFTLILGSLILKENITWQRCVATVLGFVGIVVTMSPHFNKITSHALIFILSSLGFALLDVINKIFVTKESMISMLFYSSITMSFLSMPFAYHYWISITHYDVALCILLGIGSNLILWFILKAFSHIDATATAPYRYLELLISSAIGYLLFNEIPNSTTVYGAMIIVPCTMFIMYFEKHKQT